MKKICLYFLLLINVSFTFQVYAQMVRLEPTGARPDEEVKMVFDASNGNKELMDAAKVYVHAGVVTDKPDGTAWKHVKGDWGQDNGIGEMAKVQGEGNKWEITFSPSIQQHFNVPEGENIFRLALVFRNADGTKKATINSGTYPWSYVASNGDIYIDLVIGEYVHVLAPLSETIYVEQGTSFSIKAEASGLATSMKILVDEGDGFVEMHSLINEKVIEYDHFPVQSGTIDIKIIAYVEGDEVVSQKNIKVFLHAPPLVESLPEGYRKGINYVQEDHSKAALVLEAPGKKFVYLGGDFNNWGPSDEYLMRKTPDGEYFWLELNNLTPGTEYAFQYWVEGTIKIGDPYAAKVLDPWNDQYIPASTYPGLKLYNRQSDGIASVLQTNQPVFQWDASEASWAKPPKEELVIYEILIRDFLDSRRYKDLMDTLPYLKRLGVNAIELMPIMEFEGNDSWGYNPSYFFAVDKYYGTAEDLKKLIQKAHQLGMAVILDMVLNHAFGQNPMVMMYWDPQKNTVAPESPWFNPEATHPYNVGFDFNHESPYTQAFVDSVNHYWLNEFHFDGYRFDLSKGFTQRKNPNNVSGWSAYDESRIALLKRMADRIWQHSPDAYVILEHFADNKEEKELAEYKSGEGKGMLLWDNLNHAYNQNTMGYKEESDISWVYHTTRNWEVPHVIGYMESHDEERLMYKNLQYGNASGAYDVRNLNTAIERNKGANLLFYTVPGPKMLWQFGELGFDYSINRCEDGSVNDNCRLSPKPIPWEMKESLHRESLYDFTADLIHLKNSYKVFANGTASFYGNDGLVKQLIIENEAITASPSSAEEMSAFIVVNFDVTAKDAAINFPHSGTWYDYYAGGHEITANASATNITLGPGMYKLYTDFRISNLVTGNHSEGKGNTQIVVYPNPTTGNLFIEQPLQGQVHKVLVKTMQGKVIELRRLAENQWDLSHLSAGFYILEMHIGGKTANSKIIKH